MVDDGTITIFDHKIVLAIDLGRARRTKIGFAAFSFIVKPNLSILNQPSFSALHANTRHCGLEIGKLFPFSSSLPVFLSRANTAILFPT